MSQDATKTQRRKSTVVRKTEIVDAGMRILSSEGAKLFTVEHVAAAVGITGGTIFRHFASMEEVLDAIVDRIEQILLEDFPSKGADPLDDLRVFFVNRVQSIQQHPEISRLLMTDGLIPNSNSRPRETRLRKLKRKSQDFVRQCLIEAERTGRLARDVRTDDGVLLVVGAIHAIGHMGLCPGSGLSDEEQIHRLWTLIATMLRGEGPPGERK